MPKDIISDRDKLFTSTFWQEVCGNLGIKHKLSTSFHPQTDDQTERTNRTLEQVLRKYVNDRRDNWDVLLPMAEFAINNAHQVSAKDTPFHINYTISPKITHTFTVACQT